MNTQPVDLTDRAFQGAVQAIGGSAILSFGFLIVVLFAAYILIDRLRQPPRFDPNRHMERPPVEHKPVQGLPPGIAYRDAQAEKDKDHVPWN